MDNVQRLVRLWNYCKYYCSLVVFCLTVWYSRDECVATFAPAKLRSKTCVATSTQECGIRGQCGRPAQPVAEAATSTDIAPTHAQMSAKSKKCDVTLRPALIDSGDCGRNVPDHVTVVPGSVPVHTRAD